MFNPSNKLKQRSYFNIFISIIQLFVIIIMTLRQSTQAKNIFYKGITLKQYIRKTSDIILTNDTEETIIVDQFNAPLCFNNELIFIQASKPHQPKSRTNRVESKVSSSKSMQIEPILPILQNQKPTLHKNYSFNKPENLTDRHRVSTQLLRKCKLPTLLFANDTEKILQNQNPVKQINQHTSRRQKCLASRQNSYNSQTNASRKGIQSKSKKLSNIQYLNMIKEGMIKRRYHISHEAKLTSPKKLKQKPKAKYLGIFNP